MRFHTTILAAGKTAAGIRVPDEVVSSLGSGKQPLVKVTIKRHTYRSAVAVMGGVFMVGVSAENRKAAGVEAGEEVDVDIELDTEPRVLELPADFRAALDADAGAKTFFDSLPKSRKQRLVLPIAGIKTAETRQRRISQAVAQLREGRA